MVAVDLQQPRRHVGDDFLSLFARERTGLSQSQFATLLVASVRTLQGWEQGRKQPSGAARTLLTIAHANPKVLLAAVGKSWTFHIGLCVKCNADVARH